MKVHQGKLAIIVGADRNGVIGRGGELPWKLSADLRRFKRLTMGRPIIMGRRTWESIGRPLPGRTSIVVTRNRHFDPKYDGVLMAGDLNAALGLAVRAVGGDQLVFVIGGAELYAAALPLADWLYLTRIDAEVEGDVWFPPIDLAAWRLVQTEAVDADDRNQYPTSFQVYQRIGK